MPDLVFRLVAEGVDDAVNTFETGAARVVEAGQKMMESLNQIAQAQERLAQSQSKETPTEQRTKRETQAAQQYIATMENVHSRFAALQQMGIQAYEKRLQAAQETAKKEAEIEKQKQEALDAYNKALLAVDRARADKDANRRDAERLKEIEAARKKFFASQIRLDRLEVESRTRKANALLKLSDQEIASTKRRNEALAQADTRQIAREQAEYERLIISMKGVAAQAILLARAENTLQKQVDRGKISQTQANEALEKYRIQLKEADATTRTAKQGIQDLVGSFAVLGFGPLSGIGSRIIAFNRILKVTTDQANILKKAMLGLTAVFLTFQAGIGLFNFFKNVAAELDKAQKAADRLGVTLQEYQALDFVAQRSGLDSIEQVLVRLNRAIGDTSRATGEAAAAFNDLGVDVRELRKLAPVDQLAAIADAYRDLGDAQKGISIASAIFGARQARAINILLNRGEGIHEMIDDAKRLGIVFEGSGRQAEQITDRILEMDLMMKTLKQTLVAELFPAFLTFATLLQRELGGAISFVLSLFGILTTSTLLVQFNNLNKEIEAAGETLKETRDEFNEGGWFAPSKRDVDNAIANLERLEVSKAVVATSIVARGVSEPEQAAGVLRAIEETRKRLLATESTDIEFEDEEFEKLLDMLEESEELLERNLKLFALFGRTGGDGVNEASNAVLTAVEKFRKLDRETKRAAKSIEDLFAGASRVSIAESLRLNQATKEAEDFIGELAKAEDKIDDLHKLQDFARRTEEFLGVDPDSLKSEEQAIEDLTAALAKFISTMKQTQEFEKFIDNLTNQRDAYQQQLWIVQALGADHAILTERLQREEIARRILGGTIDDHTQKLIEQLEVLERELVREERLKQFGQDLEDGIKGPIERALAGGIDSFEDFFDAILQSWRATLAEMFAEQIFNPENFGFSGGGGFSIGGFFNALGFNFADAVTPRQRAVETSIHETALGATKTAFNTSIFGEMAKTGETPIFRSGAFFDDLRADLGIPTGGPTLDLTGTSAGGFFNSPAFTGLLGAVVLGGIGYLAGQNKPFDIDASGAARVAANTLILGATTSAALALGGLAVSAEVVTGTLASIIGPLSSLAPYLLLLAGLAAVVILLVDVLSKPPRDIYLRAITAETEAEIFERTYQAGDPTRDNVRSGPFGFIGLHVGFGPGDAEEKIFQQNLTNTILKLDQAIAKTLLPEEIERVAFVLQNATNATLATPEGIERFLTAKALDPNTVGLPGLPPGWTIVQLQALYDSYLRDFRDSPFESHPLPEPLQYLKRTYPNLSDLFSSGAFDDVHEGRSQQAGEIFSELTRDPTNDVGFIIARRVELALSAIGIDAGFFGLDVASTGGFIPEDYFQKLSEVMKVRIEYIRSLDKLAGEPVTDAIQNIRALEDQFEEMAAITDALGFSLEDLVERFEIGREVLNQNFLLGVETAIFEITDPFIATMEGIRSSTDTLIRNALDLELDPEIVLELNALRVAEALEQALEPVTGVLDAIAIDRAAPLETLEILEARFQEALVGQDPGEVASTATALLQQLERTFGRTEEYFAASAVIEEQLLGFNEDMRSIAAIQLDLVRRQLEAIEEGNATQAELLQDIRDTWASIASPPVGAGDLWPIPPPGYYGSLDADGSSTSIYTAAETFTAISDQLGAHFIAAIDISQQQLIVAETGFETMAQLLQAAVDELRAIRSKDEDVADVIDLASAKKATS